MTGGRFLHSKKYVTKAGTQAGFRLVHYDTIVPRYENGRPVEGHIFVFEKPYSY